MSRMSKAIAALGVVAGLGVAALPLSSYAAFDTAKVTAEVEGSISIAVTGNKADFTGEGAPTIADNEVYLAPINGGDVATGKAAVKVTGNAPKGYKLSIKDSDNQTALVSASNAVIPAGQPTNAGASSAWGYKLDGATNYTAITTSDTPLNGDAGTSTALEAAGETTNVTFGVNVTADQPEGTYEGGVIFTAIANS